MKKCLKIIVYILAVIAFTVWLCISNNVIARSSGMIPAKRVLFEKYTGTQMVHCNIDEMSTGGTMYEIVTFRGWAFAESDMACSAPETAIILRNNTNCYALEFRLPEIDSPIDKNIILRPDVVAAFPDASICTPRVGFRSDFSIVAVKNGVYDIYVYRRENDQHYGIVHTAKQLVKDGDKVALRDRQVVPSRLADIQIVGEGAGKLDNLEEHENGLYCFCGWGYGYTQKDNSAKTISVVLKDSNSDACYVYEKEAIARPDVYDAFASSGKIVGNNHGFNVKFSVEPIPDGQYDLFIYIVENDECKCLVDMKMRFVKDGLSLHDEELLEQ